MGLNTLADAHKKSSTQGESRIYKHFLVRFKTELEIFASQINGVTCDGDLNRYASLMLTRLMFLYFIQPWGFLDQDTHYLSSHLKMIRSRKGISHNSYHNFLLSLFHDGLSKQEYPVELNSSLGNVPFLNIEIFKELSNERDNSTTIQIPDEAFARILAFFDTYCWQLDEFPPRQENTITPSILGYIFEKQINQKQMGAYYTQRDVTEYIAKSTIIPYLFNAAAKKCPTAFLAGGPIWQLLRVNPDRYIYPAENKGVELHVPSEIEVGLSDVSMRDRWNKSAPGAYALPTESWREVMARRQHYQDLRTRLEKGLVHSIDDFITCNLDIRTFAQDVIEGCKEPNLLQAFYESMSNLTVLDPTCGTGAFLIAALDILEPLYAVCLFRLGQIDATGRSWHLPVSPTLPQGYPNRHYSIIKSIITSNLYGVDIMEEATAICKMRLFLRLLAEVMQPEEIEPLPNLDGNIRTGNILIGSVNLVDYTKRSAEQREGDETFRCTQGDSSGDGLSRTENEPFHWFHEFPRIMRNGGFDVTIGNPPYVGYKHSSTPYKGMNYTTLTTGNLYALSMERCAGLLAPGGRFGMIVPASATCTDGYLPLQNLLLQQSSLHIASFSDQRGKLFDIPHPRLCIVTYQKHPGPERVFSTTYLKPGCELRESLFQRLAYTEVTQQVRPGIIPRYGSTLEQSLHMKLYHQSQRLGGYIKKAGTHTLYLTRKLSWFVQATPFIPQIIDEQGRLRNPSELKTLRFSSQEHADIAFVALNSNLFYWFLTTGSDCRNLNMREVRGFPLNIDEVLISIRRDLRKLAARLTIDFQAHSRLGKMSFKDTGTLTIQCMFPSKSKHIVDEIDHELAQHYGFTEEELDFLINYDIKYRSGRYP
jgi:hypothetical protein